MKLRIRGNTLRFRLTQSEVAELERTGYVAEAVHFAPDQTLSYRLESTEDSTIKASFRNQAISVAIPVAALAAWANSDQVGIETNIPSAQSSLRILIEKDFACLTDRVNEDDSDAFPNPNTSC